MTIKAGESRARTSAQRGPQSCRCRHRSGRPDQAYPCSRCVERALSCRLRPCLSCARHEMHRHLNKKRRRWNRSTPLGELQPSRALWCYPRPRHCLCGNWSPGRGYHFRANDSRQCRLRSSGCLRSTRHGPGTTIRSVVSFHCVYLLPLLEDCCGQT